MFTRSASVEPKTQSPARRSLTPPSSGEKSVIGNDLKIIGQGLKIIGRGTLQVDGDIEGNVQAAEVLVGEKGRVTGMVAGQQVVVRGTSWVSFARSRWPSRPRATSSPMFITCRSRSNRAHTSTAIAGARRARLTSR